MNDQATAKILVAADEAARLLSISERTFHLWRGREEFARAVPEIRLAPRCVRWRRADLIAWASGLAAATKPPEPPQLAAGRAKRRQSAGAASAGVAQ